MARAGRSRVVVEIESDPGKWSLYKSGFTKISDAEAWISENLTDGIRLRAARISGTFHREVKIIKR